MMVAVKDVVTIMLASCGGIITIGGAVSVIATWISKARNPEKRQDEQIALLTCRIEKLEASGCKYDDEMKRMNETLSLMMKAQFATLSHEINGDDVDDLKKVQSEMQNYLSKNR